MPDQLRDLIDSVRARLQADVDVQLGTLAERYDQALADAHHRARHEARRGLLSRIRDIDAAQSISGTLTAIVCAAAQEAPRAALFVGSGGPLDEWVVDGMPLMNDCEQATVAIPLLLDGDQVAVLCGHDDNTGLDVEDWRDGLAVIASHGASRLACITAIRTAQAMRWLSGDRGTTDAALKGWTTPDAALKGWTTTDAAPDAALTGWTTTGGTGAGVTTGAPPSSDEEEQAAKRYARLLVSEIKLYNESAVTTGREQRDLSRRLAPDIDRARRLYEQRVPATIAGREELFQNELVQTLAGGDSSLLE